MQQNYIAQINLFERWLETNYLSAHAQLLWYKLIALCNRCGWVDWVQVDTRRLMLMICAENKQTAFRARDALLEAGLMEYEKGKKGVPSKYRLLYFRYDFCTEYDTNSVTNSVTNNVTNSVTNSVTNTVHINKQKQKQNKDEEKDKKEVGVPEELAEAWSAFAEMRRKIKKPLTERAGKMVLNELERLAPNDIERQKAILNQSTVHNWLSVYQLKEQKQAERPASYDIDAMERQLWDNPIVNGEGK